MRGAHPYILPHMSLQGHVPSKEGKGYKGKKKKNPKRACKFSELKK